MFHKFLTKLSAASACSRVPCRGSQFSEFRISDKILVACSHGPAGRPFKKASLNQAKASELQDAQPSLSRRAENVIPKRRADAISDLIILDNDGEDDTASARAICRVSWQMVRRIMEHVVADITENQPGKHGRRKASKNQKKQTVKKKRERDAYDWRHNEPSRIVGIIVMNAVNHVVQSLSPTSLRFVMKYVPVNEVFDQRPEQNAEQKQRRYRHESTIGACHSDSKACSQSPACTAPMESPDARAKKTP